jgi:hypothetical protein
MEKQMKIEPNRFYKTRDGRKAEVVRELKSRSSERFIAVLSDPEIGEYVRLYNDGGRYVGNDRVGVSPADIISEWEEPKPRMLAYLITSDTERHSELRFYPDDGKLFTLGNWRIRRAPWLDEKEAT